MISKRYYPAMNEIMKLLEENKTLLTSDLRKLDFDKSYIYQALKYLNSGGYLSRKRTKTLGSIYQYTFIKPFKMDITNEVRPKLDELQTIMNDFVKASLSEGHGNLLYKIYQY